MVGTLLRLRWKLLLRAPGAGAGRVIAQLLVGLYLIGALVFAWVGMLALRGHTVDLRGTALTLGFSLLTLAWPLTTLVAAGSDATLDPGRFALFPVRARQLMPGLLLVGLLGMGGVFTLLLALGFVVSWSVSPSQALAAVVAVLIGVPSCVLLARTLTSWFTGALNTRRYRDQAAVVLALVGMLGGVGVQAVGHFLAVNASSRSLVTAGEIASWTPLGWAWALPWDAGRGHWLALAAHLVLAAALAGGLWLAWHRALERALVSPLESGGGGGRVKAHSLVDRMVPATPAGAVAGRSLRYWRRDPRHLVQITSVILMPVLILAPQLLGSHDPGRAPLADSLWVPVFAVVLMASLAMAQETSYDGAALWMHISSGLRGAEDRLGRVLAFGWIFTPIVALLCLVFAGLAGDWGVLARLLGTCLAALGASMAVGCVTGALWQIPMPPPGQGAFSRSSGGGMESLLMSLVSFLATGLVLLPVIILDVLAGSRAWLGVLLLLLGPLYGLVAVWVGVRRGGRILDARWPEILSRVSAQP